MKKPKQIEALSIATGEIGSGGAYPPLGYQPVWDAELGNNDYFGLYWPYGREKREPIVCDMLHDEWALEIAFSSVEVFVDWLKLNDYERGENVVDDPSLVSRRFQNVKDMLKDKSEEAISLLKDICEDFPESAEYWYTLACQLRRIGDQSGAHFAAIRTFTQTWHHFTELQLSV